MRTLLRMLLGAGLLATAAGTALAGFFYPDGATTLHFAFEGSPNGDRPIVRAPGKYYADDGYGFVDSPSLIGTSTGVTAPAYFRFDANVPPGNYDVTIRLGGSTQASNVTIRAEAHRLMAYNIDVPARGNAVHAFTVNVRGGDPKSQLINADNRLTLELSGTNPAMMKLDIKPNTTAPTVWILGDEAAMDQEHGPATGWGQILPVFFKPQEVAVANCDQRSGLNLGGLRKGDFVVVIPKTWKMEPGIPETRIAAAGATLIQIDPTILPVPEKPDPVRSPYVAFENARAVAVAIRDGKSPLAAHLWEEIPPANPDPEKFPAALRYQKPQ